MTTTAPNLNKYNGTVLVVNEDDYVDEFISTTARVLGNDKINLTISRHFLTKSGKAELAEGFECMNSYGHATMTFEQAVAFAHAILEQVSESKFSDS
jgi:hypothetical protein